MPKNTNLNAATLVGLSSRASTNKYHSHTQLQISLALLNRSTYTAYKQVSEDDYLCNIKQC